MAATGGDFGGGDGSDTGNLVRTVPLSVSHSQACSLTATIPCHFSANPVGRHTRPVRFDADDTSDIDGVASDGSGCDHC